MKKIKEIKRAAMPIMVTISGIPFVTEVTVKEGGAKTNFEKNHPLTIVPMASRNRAFFRLEFSSPMGERGAIEGLREKQKKIIRKLYTAVSIVATILKTIPRRFKILAPVASSIRSLE